MEAKAKAEAATDRQARRVKGTEKSVYLRFTEVRDALGRHRRQTHGVIEFLLVDTNGNEVLAAMGEDQGTCLMQCG